MSGFAQRLRALEAAAARDQHPTWRFPIIVDGVVLADVAAFTAWAEHDAATAGIEYRVTLGTERSTPHGDDRPIER